MTINNTIYIESPKIEEYVYYMCRKYNKSMYDVRSNNRSASLVFLRRKIARHLWEKGYSGRFIANVLHRVTNYNAREIYTEGWIKEDSCI